MAGSDIKLKQGFQGAVSTAPFTTHESIILITVVIIFRKFTSPGTSLAITVQEDACAEQSN